MRVKVGGIGVLNICAAAVVHPSTPQRLRTACGASACLQVDTYKTIQMANGARDDGAGVGGAGSEMGGPSLRELYRGLIPNLAKEGACVAI